MAHDEDLTLLIDGDILAFKAAATNQQSVRFDADGPTALYLNDAGKLQQAMADEIDKWVEELKATDVIVFLSCPSSKGWRKKVLKSYKANRKEGTNPKLLPLAKEILRTYYNTVEAPTLEADDLMGIYSTSLDLVQGERCIVSIDKDMQTIPGWLYNPDKDKEPRYISEKEANYYHLYQTLIGDIVDGYKGCPGVGPVAAKRALDVEPREQWGAVAGVYLDKGLTVEDALVQARVAYILRAGDYNFKTKKVLLWHP